MGGNGVRILAAGLVVGMALATGCSRNDEAAGGAAARADVTLLNVSYDPTREFYKEFNEAFIAGWKAKNGQAVRVRQSHGGSGKQARSVIDGLEADVVTLALAYDIDELADKGGLLPKDWQSRLPERSAPYTSTIVFLVRKGNPRGVKDWDDLARPGISVITPNPKTSGGARWNYLAAWGYALKKELGDFSRLNDPAAAGPVAAAQAKARAFVAAIYKNVPVMDSGARGATSTFVQRGMGDVLVAWENEALLAMRELGPDKLELVAPSISILAEPPVAVIDKVVDKRGTRAVAQAYLEYLYTPEGQRLAAQHGYRPRRAAGVPEELMKQFPNLELFTIDDGFGGWAKAQAAHFADGASFDAISRP